MTPGPVRSSSGVEILARGLKPTGAISTLIVAGGPLRATAGPGAREHLDAPLSVEDIAEQALA